jgi:hypothetical protein
MTPAASQASTTPILPARSPRRDIQRERLLVIDPLTRRFGDYAIAELPNLFGSGDVLLVNDAATLPASLYAEPELELRLIAAENDGTFRAVTLGRGDYRVPTELRGPPRCLSWKSTQPSLACCDSPSWSAERRFGAVSTPSPSRSSIPT